jgi:hypothetical protein
MNSNVRTGLVRCDKIIFESRVMNGRCVCRPRNPRKSIKNQMVTKYDLSDKLDNFRGDLVGFIRAEDKKVLAKLK